MKRFMIAVFCFFAVTVLLGGCSYQAVPSRYDMKLKTKTESIEVEKGGGIESIEVTVDSRSFHDTDSGQNMFLSYHIRDAVGNVVVYDGLRTALEPIPARGIKKEKVDVEIPTEAGSYTVEIDMVEENVAWFSEQGMPTLSIPLTVKESVTADYGGIVLSSSITTADLGQGEVLEIPLMIRNDSGVVLHSSGTQGVLIAYQILDMDGRFLGEGERISLGGFLNSGEQREITLSPQSELFMTPGEYQIVIGLLIEGTAWLSEWGMAPWTVTVHVK